MPLSRQVVVAVVVADSQIPVVVRTTAEARARAGRRVDSRAWVASAAQCNASVVDQTASEAVVAVRKCAEWRICEA